MTANKATVANLTSWDAILYLLGNIEKGEKMPGTVRSKEKCPICNQPYTHLPRLGLICPEHKTTPRKYYVDVYWGGQRKIYKHRSGRTLDSYQLADETLEHIRHEIRTHTFDPSRYVKSDIQGFMFDTCVGKWYEDKEREAEKGHLSWSYLKPLRGHIKNYMLPCFGQKDVRDIRTADIKEFYRQLPDRLSPKSHKNILNELENFFNTLFDDEVIEKKPSFPRINVPEPPRKWCDRETQTAVLNAIPVEHRFIFFFLTRQGIREGEACAVKWSDLDLGNRILTVCRAVSDRKIVERTKTKKIRPRLLHPEVYEILKSIPRGLPNSFLFVNPNTGRPYIPDVLQRIWKRACGEAGVDISLQQASRHSVASMAATDGVSIAIIKEVLGHTDIRTTQKYAHLHVLSQSQVFQAQEKVSTSPKLAPNLLRASK